MEYANKDRHRLMSENAQKCIDAHIKQSIAVSFIPVVSLPIVYGVCVKMILQLDKIFGIPTAKGWDSEIMQDLMTGVVAAPALIIPVLGAGVASVYIKSIGENYAQAVSAVVRTATSQELGDGAFVARRVKEELKKIYAQRKKRNE